VSATPFCSAGPGKISITVAGALLVIEAAKILNYEENFCVARSKRNRIRLFCRGG
jgi:hypothetical protein